MNHYDYTPGKVKVYISIAFGIVPIVLTIIFFTLVLPDRRLVTGPLGSFLRPFFLFTTITAPTFGLIGIYLSRSAKRDGCASILATVGLISSIVNVLVTCIPAFAYLLFLIIALAN